MALIDDLLLEASNIRDAEQDKENTALRVGTMLVDILQYIAGFVSVEGLQAVLADYAPLQGALVHWRNSRVVCLASMGTDLDNIDGGDWQYTNHTGDIVFNPSGRNLSIVGEQGTYSVFTSVIYVNLHSRHCYVWDATTQAMIEITDSSRPTIIDYRNNPPFAQVAIGESYYFESGSAKKIAIKTSSSGSYSFDPDPKKIYVFKDTCESMIWNATTRSWVTVGSNGGGISEEDIINDLITGGRKKALSAEMGKWLAMMSGSYEQAWSRSKVVTSPFCWIWDETLSDGPVKKPIWHIGNSVFIDAAGSIVSVSAGNRPGVPSFSINGTTPTDNMEVARNTQLTITPVAGAVLKYSIDDAEYITSDGPVTVTLTGSGTKTIKAYCSNSAGDSDLRTLRLVVSGIPEPSYAAGQDTTITTIGNDRIVTRGGVIVITGDEELHYRVGGGTWRTVPSSHGEAPTARVTIDGDKTIEAYNTVDGENSDPVSWSFKMEALAAPSFLPEDGHEFGESGGDVMLQHPKTVEIYYNLNDVNDPDEYSTQFSLLDPIHVTARTTIKAIAKDNYGYSAVASATYTIAVAKITVKVNADTTMSLGDTGLTAIPLSAANNNGVNEFTIDKINTLAGTSYTSFADHEFASLSFANKNAIVTFNGGGVKIQNLKGAFQGASALTSVKGIVLCAISSASPNRWSDGNLMNAFSSAQGYPLAEIELSGEVSFAMNGAFGTIGFPNGNPTLDISQLRGNVLNLTNAFANSRFETIDISGLDTTNMASGDYAYGSFEGAFSKCANLKMLTIGNLADPRTLMSNTSPFNETTGITTLICTTVAPPSLKASGGWLEEMMTLNTTAKIYVPDSQDHSVLNAYKNAAGWSAYSTKIYEMSDLSDN